MALNLPYYIEFTHNAEESIASYLSENNYSSIFILVDENTSTHCFPMVKNICANAFKIKISSGEVYKNLETCCNIWDTLTKHNADRNALLINLGGGVIGDMGGFCARTYKRGIDFINIPTTLLSQVDASIGGKLGIDYHGLKNHIGLFSIPKKVIIDTTFLNTLPKEQILSGFAEMIKHAIINSKNHFNKLANLDLNHHDFAFSYINKSIEIKNNIVQSDPEEKGNRKLLNFGHTLGHAIETYCLNEGKLVLHGNAVAAGIIIESYLSNKILNLSTNELNEIERVIDKFFERIPLNQSSINKIISYVKLDKKNKGNQVQAVLLNKIGEAQHSIILKQQYINEALKYYITR